MIVPTSIAVEPSQSGAAARVQTRTILITDDQPSVLQTLAYVFGLHGYRTLLATSGCLALEIAGKENFDAALIDLHMPGMDGVATSRALRERRIVSGRDVPVWMMSAAFTGVAATKSREAGVIALLKKPFDVEQFLAEMGRYCDGSLPIPALTIGPSPSTASTG